MLTDIPISCLQQLLETKQIFIRTGSHHTCHPSALLQLPSTAPQLPPALAKPLPHLAGDAPVHLMASVETPKKYPEMALVPQDQRIREGSSDGDTRVWVGGGMGRELAGMWKMLIPFLTFVGLKLLAYPPCSATGIGFSSSLLLSAQLSQFRAVSAVQS